MRIILGLLLLGGLFLMAALWQGRITERLHGERRLRHGIPAAGDRRGDDWARLVLGRPSGVDPLPAPTDLSSPAPVDEEQEFRIELPDFPPDYHYVVTSKDVLGKICQAHYDSQYPLRQLVAAVAAYNDLRSANDIRAGHVLLLPDLGILFPED